MSLELTSHDNNQFTDERISNQSILVGYGSTLATFHELSTKNLCIATILHKDAI